MIRPGHTRVENSLKYQKRATTKERSSKQKREAVDKRVWYNCVPSPYTAGLNMLLFLAMYPTQVKHTPSPWQTAD